MPLIGAQPLYFDYIDRQSVVIKEFNCHSTEPRLRDCDYSYYSNNCHSVGGAAVRCRAFKNINAVTINNSVFIIWEYYSTSHQQLSFDVHCFNERNYTRFSVSDGTFRVNVGDLFPLASYNCCVSAKYGTTTAEITCTAIRSEDLSAPTEMLISSDSNTRANIVGGVLGFIVVILVLVLAMCGGALLYLLRSRGVIPKR